MTTMITRARSTRCSSRRSSKCAARSRPRRSTWRPSTTRPRRSGRGAYTLKELEAYVKSTHKEYMGFGRGGTGTSTTTSASPPAARRSTASPTRSTTTVSRTTSERPEPGLQRIARAARSGAPCRGARVVRDGAAGRARADSSSDMRKMSLIDYCSPNSNGDMDRDSMDDQIDEVAYSFEYGVVREAGFGRARCRHPDCSDRDGRRSRPKFLAERRRAARAGVGWRTNRRAGYSWRRCSVPCSLCAVALAGRGVR